MSFDQDPADTTGPPAGRADGPARDSRGTPRDDQARLARIAQIDHDLGVTMDEVTAGEALVRSTLARRCDLAAETLRLYEERGALLKTTLAPGAPPPTVTARREAAMELGVALGMPEGAGHNLITQGVALLTELPATRTALAQGQISFPHVQVITREASSLPPEARTAFEAAVIPEAALKTVPQFKKRVRLLRERLDPIPLSVRHDRAKEERTVWVDTAPDGMATLHYTDSAERVIPIYNRIDTTARALKSPDDGRTIPQLRADTLADLGLNGTPTQEYDKGVKPTVLIAVPALTAMGEGMQPGMMEGYGPIDPDTARLLAAKAPSFFRILTEPESGAILSVGRTAYKPPADLRRFLLVRDGTCRGPGGCQTEADRCDVDHTVDWQYGGETVAENLAHLCRSHHNFKQNSSWTVTQIGGGRLKWTSPSGKFVITDPNSFIGPMPFIMPTPVAIPPTAADRETAQPPQPAVTAPPPRLAIEPAAITSPDDDAPPGGDPP